MKKTHRTDIRIEADFINNGPDTLFFDTSGTSDTLFWQALITDRNSRLIVQIPAGALQGSYLLGIVDKGIYAPKDTVRLRGGLFVSGNVSVSRNIYFAISAMAVNRSKPIVDDVNNSSVRFPIVWYNNDRWAVSVTTLEKTRAFSVYPIPAKEKINVSVSDPGLPVTYSIFGLDGKKHMESSGSPDNKGNLSIDSRNLPNGTYLLNMNQGTTSHSQVIEIKH